MVEKSVLILGTRIMVDNLMKVHVSVDILDEKS